MNVDLHSQCGWRHWLSGGLAQSERGAGRCRDGTLQRNSGMGGGKGGATNLKVGGQCIGRCGVNTVKSLTFEKGGGCMTPPPVSMVAPTLMGGGLKSRRLKIFWHVLPIFI